MHSLSHSARGHLAMLTFSATVAGSFSLGGAVANEIAPAAINTVRFVIAVAVLVTFVQIRGPRIRRWHLVAPWRYLVLGGLFAAYFVLMFEALKTATPVSTSAIFTLTPLFSAGFGFLLLRQLLTARMAAALAVGAAGALWVIFRADLQALLAFELGRGEAIFFVGMIAHAALTPLLKRLNRGEPALISTTLLLTGSLVVLLVYGWSDVRATDWTALRPMVWVAILYLAIAASCFTTLMLQYASLRLPAAKVMAYTYLTPSWVICWELALTRTVPTLLLLPGIGLTIVALLLLLKEDRPMMPEVAQESGKA